MFLVSAAGPGCKQSKCTHTRVVPWPHPPLNTRPGNCLHGAQGLLVPKTDTVMHSTPCIMTCCLVTNCRRTAGCGAVGVESTPTEWRPPEQLHPLMPHACTTAVDQHHITHKTATATRLDTDAAGGGVPACCGESSTPDAETAPSVTSLFSVRLRLQVDCHTVSKHQQPQLLIFITASPACTATHARTRFHALPVACSMCMMAASWL